MDGLGVRGVGIYEREAVGASGKSRGRKEGQRKQDLAEAPPPPIRKQPPANLLIPTEPLPDQGGGRAFQRPVGPASQRQGGGAGLCCYPEFWVMLGQGF